MQKRKLKKIVLLYLQWMINLFMEKKSIDWALEKQLNEAF